MNRDDFRALARTRLREARTLRDRQLWSGCYYLTGFALECALKACIAGWTQRYDFPDKKRVDQSYTHDLAALVKVAGLEQALLTDSKASPALGRNWGFVKEWSVEARYNRRVTAAEARALYRAVTQRRTGALAWVRRHW
jgi:hypothetical protein